MDNLTTYLIGQGVLGVAAFLLWRRNEALEKLVLDIQEKRIDDAKRVNETMVGPIENLSLRVQRALDAVPGTKV